MPSPSPEARAKDRARNSGSGSYMKDGRLCYYVHVGHACSCCWQELTVETSQGDGTCEFCSAHMARMEDLPCDNWSKDMKTMWTKHHHLNRQYFEMKNRTVQPRYRSHAL